MNMLEIRCEVCGCHFYISEEDYEDRDEEADPEYGLCDNCHKEILGE